MKMQKYWIGTESVVRIAAPASNDVQLERLAGIGHTETLPHHQEGSRAIFETAELRQRLVLDARNELRQRAEDVDARGAFLETCAQETAGWSTSAKLNADQNVFVVMRYI